ncbi:Peroxidase [Mycena indigotica]|uniref:Peroxidase n=1 Tax=Mycena indigotica TaxID=2126181 RepID=A0A8H6W0M1_9AGAR|nr:Peroxidase [Mycena indigotica]KAF7301124.1 Peroxidase [Mycena indigotica]
MPPHSSKTTLLLLAALRLSQAHYIWPNKHDILEDSLTVSGGLGQSGMMAEIATCGAAPFGGRLVGRQSAAEWLRVAYHDMATHDVHTGLGGLDGSIGFETDRPQNIGSAMNTSMVFFATFQGKTSSVSDVMALSVVLAMKQCNGPSIPFRAGRIDATAAGPDTVPEPQQDLATHTTMFANQGFNVEEMIGLVACGHTVGGIHEVDFPDSVPATPFDPNNPEGVVHFDQTFDDFDNHIATEWIDGTTNNLLAVGHNATTNSDARIFAADNNVTMKAFAKDATSFQKTCGNLFERMLNTVPKSVQLTDVIDPLPVKPYQLALNLADDGSLELSGYIRIFSTAPEAMNVDPENMVVNLSWKDHNGNRNSTYTSTLTAGWSNSTSLWGFVHFFPVYTKLDPNFGLSTIFVDWAFNAQEALTHADNGGAGFPLNDVVFYQDSASCNTLTNTTIVVNIRNNLGPVSDAFVDYYYNVNQQGTIALKTVTVHTPLTRTGSSASALYDVYTAVFPRPPRNQQGRTSFDVTANVGGKVYTQVANLAIQNGCGL